MMIALLSFSLINLLNNHLGNFKLNIGFAILFAFSLSLTIGVIWEIIEFAADSWFGLNMQRAYVSTMDGRGDALLGQAALKDTMKDLILDSIGAGFVCVLCAIFAHKKKIDIDDLSFIKRSVKKVVPASTEVNVESVNNLTYDSALEEKKTEENLKNLSNLNDEERLIEENDSFNDDINQEHSEEVKLNDDEKTEN